MDSRQIVEQSIMYIPMDRRLALLHKQEIPRRISGAVLFADISGFAPLAEALYREIGPRKGAEELTRHLNNVYGALIDILHQYRGSVIGFNGDATMCWLDEDQGHRAVTCGLAMQQIMQKLTELRTPDGKALSLAIKIAINVGSASRFKVGDPEIQFIDVLAGKTIDTVTAIDKLAENGEVVVSEEVVTHLGNQVTIRQWRGETTDKRMAVISGMEPRVESTPWQHVNIIERPDGKILSETEVRSWLLPPIFDKIKSGYDSITPEIRPVVTLFLGFGGIDYDQDDAAGKILDVFIQQAQKIVTSYGGHILQVAHDIQGSFLYAAFGAPLTFDDDAVRAITTALELKALPAQLDSVTTVRIGISQGQLQTSGYGSLARRTYGVLGNEVNVAAWLMQCAKPGQILVSQRIVNAAARRFHFSFVGEIEDEGKEPHPVPVSLVLGKRSPSPQRPFAIFGMSLTGREKEQEKFGQILDDVLNGQGRILDIEGATGVGKSHLTAELIETALNKGFQTALGTCQSTTQSVAVRPWQQIFRALLDIEAEPADRQQMDVWATRQITSLETLIEKRNQRWSEHLPLICSLLGLPLADDENALPADPKLHQDMLFSLAVEMIQAQSRIHPLLLAIDDIQWLDEASMGLLLRLCQYVDQIPICLLLVHRPLDRSLPSLLREPAHCHRLSLRELSWLEVVTFVTDRLQSRVSALVLDLIYRLARGNPFFTQELVDAMRETGHLLRTQDKTWLLSATVFDALYWANCLKKEDGRWRLIEEAPLFSVELGIPDSIHGAVLSRIDRLPETHKLTLKTASVIGHSFDLEQLTMVHPDHPDTPSLLRQIKMLQLRGLVFLEESHPQPIYRFRHNIIREVAYSSLPEDQRSSLHEAVAQVLEALHPGQVEELAYHYAQSNNHDKTLFYLDKSALKAQREHVHQTALRFYDQALSLEERWEWLKNKAELLHILGKPQDEAAVLISLDQQHDAPEVELASLMGQYFESVGDYSQAQVAVEQALAFHQEQGNLAGEVGCLTQLGLIARRRGDHEQAKEFYRLAMEALTQPQKTYTQDEARTLARILNGLGTVHLQQGGCQEAEACHQQALNLSRERGLLQDVAQALDHLGRLAFQQRQHVEAEAHHQQALKIRREIGDQVGEGMSWMHLSRVARDEGDFSRALEYLQQALTIHQTTDNRCEEISVENDLGILCMTIGNLSQAQAHFQRGLNLSEEIGDEAGKAYLLCNVGRLMRERNRIRAAERYLIRSMGLASALGDDYLEAMCLSHLGSLNLKAGRLELAIEQAQAALEMHRERQLKLLTTMDLTTLGMAYQAQGHTPQAVDCIRQALGILRENKAAGPEFPHYDYFQCYQVLSSAGHEEESLPVLQAAYDSLMAQVDRITNPDMRQSFLERVHHNQEIVHQMHRKLKKNPPSSGDIPGLERVVFAK